MAEHLIDISPATVHGTFSRARQPVLTVDSGDTVTFQTLDAWWGLEPFSSPYGPRRLLDTPDRHRGHALTGPIAVRNLRPGDTLEIFFERLTPSPRGFTECGGIDWDHYVRLGCASGAPHMLLWDIDEKGATTTIAARPFTVPTRPFLGVVGMPPSAPGEHSTTPPRVTGGNLDCNLMTAGSHLFLPVEVDGGLLSLGDGHAAQGDGEVSNNGIECAMNEVRITLTRRTDMPLKTPVVRTSDSWVALGLAPTLDEAAYRATNQMLDIMCAALSCSRVEALGLASACVDLRVTQVVNGIKGVHAVWKVC